MKQIGIYGLQNKLQPNKWYVGQSTDIAGRWNEYRLLRCKNQRKWFNALKKYGYDAFIPHVLEECDIASLSAREAHWVKEKNSVVDGYNCKTGGFNGGKHSEETKEILRKLATGRKKSPETMEKLRAFRHADESKKRISEALKGNQYRKGIQHTEEDKLKMSRALKGRRKSQEHRAKIAAAHIGISIPHTEETKRKISLASKAAWAKRKASTSTNTTQ